MESVARHYARSFVISLAQVLLRRPGYVLCVLGNSIRHVKNNKQYPVTVRFFSFLFLYVYFKSSLNERLAVRKQHGGSGGEDVR